MRGAGGLLELDPWTWCWSGLTGGVCSDGAPPDDPPDVGAADQVTVSFPVPGWDFTATFRPVGQACAREQRVDLVTAVSDGGSTSGGTIAPAGRAGAYDVDLSGRGPGGNDVNVTFRWTTPIAGPAPVPAATIAVLDEHDGQVAGYGVSLGSAPFTYDVVLTLDGAEHRATATWPRDERSGPEESPDTPLRFTPPLPAPTS